MLKTVFKTTNWWG